jgi:hypothetical protein
MKRLLCCLVIVLLSGGVASPTQAFDRPLLRHHNGQARVVDSHGRQVGEIISIDERASSARVALQFGAQTVILVVQKAGFYPGPLQLYFELPDCVGRAYITTAPFSTLLPYSAVTATHELFVQEAHTVEQTIILASRRLTESGDCTNSSETSLAGSVVVGQPYDVVPLERLIDLDDLFTPPFHIQ